MGVSAAGNIAGYYTTFDGTTSGTYGFLYNGSTYTTLNAPGASGSGTKATSIYGTTVAGYYYGALGAVHGFLYNSTSSSYTTLDFSGATETYIYGIDGANVVGYYTKEAVINYGSKSRLAVRLNNIVPVAMKRVAF